jgi:hypothetical protein
MTARARAAVVAGLVAGLLTLLPTGIGPAAEAGDTAADTAVDTAVDAAGDADGGRWAADRVLVVGVPGLAWTDLSPERTPELWALAENAPVGALSVRAARSITCVLDGWATLGAGNRARYPGPEEPLTPVPLPTVPLPGDEGGEESSGAGGSAVPRQGPASLCDLQQVIGTVALSDPEHSVGRIADDEGTMRFGAEPAALGAQVGCATAVGRPATLAVASPGVDLAARDGLPASRAEVAALLGDCPLIVVSLDGLFDTADLGPDEAGPPIEDVTVSAGRRAALADVDEAVGLLRRAADGVPGETLFLVAGVSEVDDERARLHVGIVSGPGFERPGWLTSASTGRAPYVQLIDLAPTVLRALATDVPASMNGQPLRVAGERPPLAAAVSELEVLNVAARAHYRSTGILFWTLVVAVAAVVVLGVLTLGRRPGGRPVGEGRRRALRGVALTVAALPVASYLANLAPWERAGASRLALLAAVICADAAVVALAAAGPWRRRRLGPPVVVLAVTAVTLVIDVLAGSPMELNGLLGYDAIVAGRFTGYGNLTFGLLAVSVLLLTAAAATAAGRHVPAVHRRTAVVGTVVVLGLSAVGVIGTPALGRDFGGVLAALPGFALLAMLLIRTRVTPARLLAVLGAAVVAVGTLAVLDWRRPPGDRSHLGRFVEQAMTGEAATVVLRKAQANLDILLGSPLVWTLPSAALAAVWLLRPGGFLRSRPGDDGAAVPPAGLVGADACALRAGLLAVATSLFIGAAVNDSGVAVPATAAALLVPLLVWLAAAPGAGAPSSGPDGDADRVTVASRGSSDWNT